MRWREVQRRGDVGARIGERLAGQRVHQVEVDVAEYRQRRLTCRTRLAVVVHAPECLRNSGSKLCTPNDRRLMPAALKSVNLSCSKVPGLASSVISASGDSGTRARTAARMRSMASAENRLGVPPPKKHRLDAPSPYRRQCELEIGDQSIDVLCLGHVAAALVRVEIAIRTFFHAPRNVHVERERRQRGEARRAQCPGHHRSPLASRRAISARNACPRCDTLFFCSSGSSAPVSPVARSRKCGS